MQIAEPPQNEIVYNISEPNDLLIFYINAK